MKIKDLLEGELVRLQQRKAREVSAYAREQAKSYKSYDELSVKRQRKIDSAERALRKISKVSKVPMVGVLSWFSGTVRDGSKMHTYMYQGLPHPMSDEDLIKNTGITASELENLTLLNAEEELALKRKLK